MQISVYLIKVGLICKFTWKMFKKTFVIHLLVIISTTLVSCIKVELENIKDFCLASQHKKQKKPIYISVYCSRYESSLTNKAKQTGC